MVVGEKHSLALQTWMAPEPEEHFGLVPGVNASAATMSDQGCSVDQPPHSRRARPSTGSSGSSSNCSPSNLKADAIESLSAELRSHDPSDRQLVGAGCSGTDGWHEDGSSRGAYDGSVARGGAVPSLQVRPEGKLLGVLHTRDSHPLCSLIHVCDQVSVFDISKTA